MVGLAAVVLPLICRAAGPQGTVAREAPGSASPLGIWRTVDDKTGKPRGTIRIFERNGELAGVVESSADPKEANDVCDKCSGERRNQRVVGMEILRGMKKKGDEYTGGEILDPDTGSVYKCRMVVEDGGRRLMVRGYIGIPLAGRTQYWYRDR